MKTNNNFDEIIFELRKQGMSYQKIRDELLQQYGENLDLKTISLQCKNMFKENGIDEPTCQKGRKGKWNQVEQEEQISDEIFKLKEQGYSNIKITEVLNTKGIPINTEKVGSLCKKIYSEKGIKIPKAAETSPMNRDELYDLAEKGVTNHEIFEMLKRQGVEITFSKLSTVMRDIYIEKGNKRAGGRQKIKHVTEEELYNLKMQGKSINDIAKYYKSKGIKIAETSVYKKAKKVFEAKNEEMPKAIIKGPKEKQIPEIYKTKIYELRQNNLSIQEIMDKLLLEDGIKLSRYFINKTLNTVYSEKGEEEPKAKVGRKRKRIDQLEKKKKIKDYDEQIYSLREQGYGINAITNILEKEYEFKVASSTVYKRIKKLYGDKDEEIPKASKSKRIKEHVLELRKQGLKYKEIVEKMNSDYGIKVDKYTVNKICNAEYGKATRKQIEEIGRLQKLEEELNKLQQTKQESELLLEQYRKLQNMREDEQNDREL